VGRVGYLLPVPMDRFLVGAWTRARLIVDGAQCRDQCRVLWLQTSDWFADLRIPSCPHDCSVGRPEAIFARPWAFAGRASWEPPVMTWQHQLDSMREPIIDSIPLDRKGDLLVEAGSFKWAGLDIPFREEWRRISQCDDEVSAQAGPNRIEVTVGAWRIVVEDEGPLGPFRASRLDFEDGAWRTTGTILEPASRRTTHAAYGADSRSRS
jgi:hypothetical protein